jgi:hypothetical protein
VLGGEPAQRMQEIRIDRQFAAIGAGRLDYRGGDIPMLLQKACQRRLVVLIAQQHVPSDGIKHPGRRRAIEMIGVARGHMVVPAVEMVVEADQLRLAGKGAGKAHRHQGGLGPGGGEPHPLGRGDQPHDRLSPGDLQFVTGAEMGAAVDLSVHRFGHLGMAMPQQQRAMPAEIVDIAAAVDIPFSRPLGMVDVEAIGLDVTGIVGDAAWEQHRRLLGLRRRARGRGAVGGDDRRVRRQAVGHIGLSSPLIVL